MATRTSPVGGGGGGRGVGGAPARTTQLRRSPRAGSETFINPSGIRIPSNLMTSPIAPTSIATAPVPAAPIYSSGGGGGGYGGGGMAAAVAPPPRMSDEDWLGADSQYNAALAALTQKLKDFEVENTSTREKGVLDYDNALQRLGWMRGADGADGSWNQEDRSTAYGNAYQNQMGDFASRGVLQSTLYDQARNDLLGRFNRQKSDMDTSHTSFLEELARALSTRRSDTQLGKDQARVEALARRAAQESGLG